MLLLQIAYVVVVENLGGIVKGGDSLILLTLWDQRKRKQTLSDIGGEQNATVKERKAGDQSVWQNIFLIFF